MKRKLDKNNEAQPVQESRTKTSSTMPSSSEPTFAELGLDPRLVQAVALQKFESPTPVQRNTIPLVLNGKDVMAKAPCGSGKTAAYVLPVFSGILSRKAIDASKSISALILAPTRELSAQITRDAEKLTAFCAKDVQMANLTDKLPDAVRSILATSPDVIISTPASAAKQVASGSLSVSRLSYLVLDEADLVLSYGYSEDLENLARLVPKTAQIIMMSATLTDELDALQGLFGRRPILLDIEDTKTVAEKLTQYVVECGEDEKFLLLYVIFKLQLLKGAKFLVFVADIDRSYRLKLFLEYFGIRSCILNSELPVNSRINIVDEFNRGVYHIIIASDEKNEMFRDEEKAGHRPNPEIKKDGEEAKKANKSKAGRPACEPGDDKEPAKNKRKGRKQDREYGVSRGIDFKNVAAVINFDLPTSSSSYSHRIGRTARAGQSGIALSFVVPKDRYRMHIPTTVATAENDEKILHKIIKKQAAIGREVKPYNFDMSQVDAFRYRMNDALRAVTKVAIREARTRELRKELLNSEKLKRYFEENPDQLCHLSRHDNDLRTSRQLPHLKNVPDYLLPQEGKQALTAQEIGCVSMKKEGGKTRGRGHMKSKSGRMRGKPGGFKSGAGVRKRDPLKNLRGRRKTR